MVCARYDSFMKLVWGSVSVGPGIPDSDVGTGGHFMIVQ